RPESVSPRIELVGELSFQDGFRHSITYLLSPISRHRRPPVMPNHGGGTEPDAVAVFEQAPTNVHVISSGSKDRVKAADVLQRLLTETHIAARYMLGKLVIEHYLSWTTGRAVHALSHPVVVARNQVRSAHADDIEFQVRCGKIGEPVRVGIGIGIDVCDDLSACHAQSLVPGGAHALVDSSDPSELWIPPH